MAGEGQRQLSKVMDVDLLEYYYSVYQPDKEGWKTIPAACRCRST